MTAKSPPRVLATFTSRPKNVLTKLEAEVDLLKANKLSTDDVVHESATFHERWPKMPVDDKRKVVEALIEKIVIGDGD